MSLPRIGLRRRLLLEVAAVVHVLFGFAVLAAVGFEVVEVPGEAEREGGRFGAMEPEVSVEAFALRCFFVSGSAEEVNGLEVDGKAPAEELLPDRGG